MTSPKLPEKIEEKCEVLAQQEYPPIVDCDRNDYNASCRGAYLYGATAIATELWEDFDKALGCLDRLVSDDYVEKNDMAYAKLVLEQSRERWGR